MERGDREREGVECGGGWGEGYENEYRNGWGCKRRSEEGVKEGVKREWERNPVKHTPCGAERQPYHAMGDDAAISVTSHVLRGRIVNPMPNTLSLANVETRFKSVIFLNWLPLNTR